VSKLSERRREIRGMDRTSAAEELKTLRRQLFDLRIQKERGEVKDTRQFAKTKADIARLIHHISELRHAERVEAEGTLEPEAAAPATEPTAKMTRTPRATRATAATETASEKTGAAQRRRATSTKTEPTEPADTATSTAVGSTAGTRATVTPPPTAMGADVGGTAAPSRPAPEPAAGAKGPENTPNSEDEDA
jgi:ribosomal protein L29